MAKRYSGLTDVDRRAVSEAIAAAEAGTSGEVFCIVARASGDYRAAPLAWAAGAALLLPAAAVFLGWVPQFPGWRAEAGPEDVASRVLWTYALIQMAVFLAVLAVGLIPSLRKLMTPRSLRRAYVRRAAMEQFLAKGLHLTEDRTGVLIYASLEEQQVEVVADQAVHRLVSPDIWVDVAEDVMKGFRSGDPASGFVMAVTHCGEVLADRFPPRPGHRNELPNRIVEI